MDLCRNVRAQFVFMDSMEASGMMGMQQVRSATPLNAMHQQGSQTMMHYNGIILALYYLLYYKSINNLTYLLTAVLAALSCWQKPTSDCRAEKIIILLLSNVGLHFSGPQWMGFLQLTSGRKVRGRTLKKNPSARPLLGI